jgi:hypothetical protein
LGVRVDDIVGGGGRDEEPRMEGLAAKVEGVGWLKAEGVVVVVIEPKGGLGCPNAGVDVVLLNPEGVDVNAEGVFDVPESRDPKVNADAGIAPNGDDPNDEAGFEKADVPPPKADWFVFPNAFCVAPPKVPPVAPPSNLPLG